MNIIFIHVLEEKRLQVDISIPETVTENLTITVGGTTS